MYALYLYAALHAPCDRITSAEIGQTVGINSTQVRRDLAMLRIKGRRGVGYDALELAAALRRELAPSHADMKRLARLARERAAQLAEITQIL